ncbi:VWA domain-containing protein [Roseimaritima sediminicola]|uniref:VWA domain-containing protein n=1 Tax=Roseimaritima sediminicola TaxID=2662066 RepID=UPI001F407E18|nr:VWA domain-containing protein [Roseimaritima sediminicola]
MDAWNDLQLQWLYPRVLWWLLLVLPVLVGFHFRSLSDFPLWQRRLSLALRIALVVCLLLALSGVMLLAPTQRQMIVFAVDQSQSIDAAAADEAQAFLADAVQIAEDRSDVTLRYVTFGAEAAAATDALPDTAGARPGESTRVREPVLGTHLAAALEAAAATVPPSYVPRLVLLSDGNETGGDAVATAATVGVPIDTVALPVRREAEVQLSVVEAPNQVRQGQPFYVDVVVSSNRDTAGTVELYRNDIRVETDIGQDVSLQRGENRFRFRQTIVDQRQVTFAAAVRVPAGNDTLAENNTASAMVFSEGRPRVLVIDPEPQQIDPLRWALDQQEIELEVRPPAGLPQDLAGLQGFQCVMLSNVPATAMTVDQMQLLGTWVQELGGGLIMLGGDQSFGLGGYYKTHLEQILPVRCNFEKEREKPALAMVLVIDRSGSMGGEKIRLAQDAAAAAAELIGPRDSLGVIAFDNETYWVSRLLPGTQRGTILEQIATIDAGGGTNMYPAMQQAYEALADASAQRKHCLLLTDGISSPGPFAQLATEMFDHQITVTTVALGDGADQQRLEEISRLGGGRHYVCQDPQSVPQVFAKETVQASKEALQEEPFLPLLVRPTEVLSGVDVELSPLLLGYVVTEAKPTGQTILSTETGDPLLTWWQYGLGKTVAFTSDVKSQWAAEWLAWPQFGQFWAQVIRHTMRTDDHQGIFVRLQSEQDRTRLIVDAVDPQGGFVDQAEATLNLIGPDQQRRRMTLLQTAPGRYETTFASNQSGAYQIDLAVEAGSLKPLRQSRGFVVGYPEELRLRPAATETLQAIARVSGGRYAPSPAEVLRRDARHSRLPIVAWPYLLMTAVVLFVMDVAVRRIVLEIA